MINNPWRDLDRRLHSERSASEKESATASDGAGPTIKLSQSVQQEIKLAATGLKHPEH